MKKGQIVIIHIAVAAIILLIVRIHTANVSEYVSKGSFNENCEKNNESAIPDECEHSLCVTLLGSIALGENFSQNETFIHLKEKKYDYYFSNYTEFLKRSQVVIAGLESPLVDSPPFSDTQSKIDSIYWADAEKAAGLFTRQGITAVSLANSHILDRGQEGLKKTIEVLDEQNIEWFGATEQEELSQKINYQNTSHLEPYRLERKIGNTKLKLAVFGVTKEMPQNQILTGETLWKIAELDGDAIAEKIVVLKVNEPDIFVIVYPFWGKDYQWALIEQQKIARKMIDAGADLVVGYGTHMLSEIEMYQDRWIAYGLGNFVFNSVGQYTRRNLETPFSGVLRIVFKENTKKNGHNYQLKMYPIYTDNTKSGYKGRFLNVKELGTAYWHLIDKHKIDWNGSLKKELYPERDRYGRYFQLKRRGSK